MEAGGKKIPFATVLIVAAVAFAVRAAVVVETRGLPQFEVPVLDSRSLLHTGASWAAGTPLPPRPFFMSPGYTGFIALCSRLSSVPQFTAVCVQIVADVAAVVAVALLARRWFGGAAGLVAGLLLALHWPQVLFTTRILDASLGSALVALLAWRLAAVDERPNPRRLFVVGLVVGLLALLRSTALVFLPPALLLFAWRWRRDGLRPVTLRLSLLLLGVALPIAPVTWRNATAGGEAVLLTSSGGVNFFIGNARGTDGRFQSLNEMTIAPGRFADDPTDGAFELSVKEFAEQQRGRALSASEVSNYYFERARTEIAAAPRAWVAGLARKVWLFANAFEIPQVDNVYFLARYVPAWMRPLVGSSRLLWPLAWFGLAWMAIRRRRLPVASTLLFAAAYAFAIALFFVTDRYRLWITPIAALGAAAAFDALRQAWRGGIARGAAATAALAACGVVFNLNPALFEPTEYVRAERLDRGGWFGCPIDYLDFRSQHSNMAAICLEGGDAERAVAEARAGLELSHDHPILLLNLARALVARSKQGATQAAELADLDEATAALRRSGARQPGNGMVGRVLADALQRRFALHADDLATDRELAPLLYQRGDFTGAAAVLERWVALAPDDPEAWNTLGANRLKLGQTKEGIAAMGTAATLAPRDTKYAYNLGLALLRAGEFDEAVATLERLVPKEPAARATAPATVPYAEALVGAGRKNEARALLAALLARQPDQLGALLTLGELELSDGRRDAAKDLLDRAMKRNPKSERALALKRRLDG